MRTSTEKRKIGLKISLVLCSALYFFFRLYSLFFSFLRKIEEWAYTKDYMEMDSVLNFFWIVMIVIPTLLSLAVALLMRLLERRFEILTNNANKEIYVKRLGPVTIVAAVMTIILSVIHFLREHTFMEYISKYFGTITALGYDFLDWGFFNFIISAVVVGFVFGIYLYLFRGFNKDKYEALTIGFGLVSIIFLILMEFFALRLWSWVNTYTISTWFA